MVKGKETLNVPERKFHRSQGDMGSKRAVAKKWVVAVYKDLATRTFIKTMFMTQKH